MTDATQDSQIISRIVAMRESVRRNKQRAIEVWNSCVPVVATTGERENLGRFTDQLVKT